MVTAFREALLHLGEWDRENHFYERMHALLGSIEAQLLEEKSIQQICEALHRDVVDLRIALVAYAAENEELQKLFSGEIPVRELASARYPSLAQRVNQYLHLITRQMPSVNELITRISGGNNYTNALVGLAFRTSVAFELCLVIADLLMQRETEKSAEWVEDLERYMKANFVFYMASLVEMDLLEIADEQAEEYPILNNALICAGEFGFRGTSRADLVLNEWGKTA